MGIDVSLQSETGNECDYQGDPLGRLETLLPAEEDPAYPFLNSIDPYGDTIFNRVQMNRFLQEWTYVESRAETDYDKDFAAAVRRMATYCRDNVHLYLKFIGD